MNQNGHGSSKFGKLLDYVLCCAIWSRHDDTVSNQPDIDDATHGLPNVEPENGSRAPKPK